MPLASRSMTRTQFSQQKAQRWFDAGCCAAAAADVLTHPGSDTAKVRRALRTLTDQGITDTAARRSYAKGVRAKLTDYRAQGLL
uniref:Uncharacterized protein n=2 Tax=unclassified Mycobacterium TaxID=2642494 RepID=A0A5Q5BTC1_MYCSS